MGMKFKYRRNPKLLEADVTSKRYLRELKSDEREGWGKPRIRPRAVGKRELLAHGVRNETEAELFFRLPENQHRKPGKNLFKKAFGTRNRT